MFVTHTPLHDSAMIEALEAENADLKKNLGLAASKQNEIKDQQITSKFEELLSKQGKSYPYCNSVVPMASKSFNDAERGLWLRLVVSVTAQFSTNSRISMLDREHTCIRLHVHTHTHTHTHTHARTHALAHTLHWQLTTNIALLRRRRPSVDWRGGSGKPRERLAHRERKWEGKWNT